MFRKRRQIVGIDVTDTGANAVVVEASSDARKLYIREYVMLGRDEGQPLEDLVAGVYAKLRTRSKECAISAWPPGSVLRFAEDDATDPRQIRRRLLKEAGGAIDHHVLDCVRLQGARKERGWSYLACGIPYSELTQISKVFTGRGVSVRLLQLAPIAIFNAFQASHEDAETDAPYLLLDFGERTTTVIAGRGSELQLIRVVEWGAAPVRALLLDAGLLWPPTSIQIAKEDAKEAKETIQPLIRELMREVRQSMDFLYRAEERRNERTQDGPVGSNGLQTIYISGPLSSMGVFVETLGAELQMACQQWNPLRRMVASKRALVDFRLLTDLSRLPAAAGAAIQCLV